MHASIHIEPRLRSNSSFQIYFPATYAVTDAVVDVEKIEQERTKLCEGRTDGVRCMSAYVAVGVDASSVEQSQGFIISLPASRQSRRSRELVTDSPK